MTKVIFDGDIAATDTVTISHDTDKEPVFNYQQIYFVNGGETSASVELEFRMRPVDSETFHAVEAAELKNTNFQDGVVLSPDTRGAAEVELIMANQENETIHLKIVNEEIKAG